jgi:hypothetical protein
MRLQHINSSHASMILVHGGPSAAFAAAWQRWLIAGVQAAIFPAFFLWYAAAPRLFHRFMAVFWSEQCDRITLLIKDIHTNAAEDFLAHPSSSSYWGLDDCATHKDELLLIRADAADACALHHHLADLLAAAPAKRKMNSNYSPQDDL